MSDDQQFRYNCLELAHRLMPGNPDITDLAEKFHAFVVGNTKPGDGYVMAFLAHPSAGTSKVYRAVAIAASKEHELDWAAIDEATRSYWTLMPSYLG